MFGIQLGKGTKQTAAPDPETQKVKTVGVLQFVSHPALDAIYDGIKAGLKDSGYVENKNLKIDFMNGQADQSKLQTMSTQLLQANPDAVVGIATPAAQSLANETKTVTLVLGAVTDPVGAGLVKNMDKPGANITGVSDKAPLKAIFDLTEKILPKAKTVGILYSSAEDNSKYQVEEAKTIAEKMGLKVKTFAVPSTNEISTTVSVMAPQVDFIFVPTDNTIASAMNTVIQVADKTNTPVIPTVDTEVEQGGLATIGINQFKIGVETGKMTARILDGKEKPATTPIYTFKTGDLIVNTKQAKKLGITIPKNIIADAKDVSAK
jgi:putative ABC transport system substrate-binding protein